MQEHAIERTLEKIVHDKNSGLFLLDPPTGFGKTTAVVKIIKRFLRGDEAFKHIKRVYFVTNLIIKTYILPNIALKLSKNIFLLSEINDTSRD